MRQLSISSGPAGTLLIAADSDNPIPSLIQNVDPANILYIGKDVGVNPANPLECTPLGPGQSAVANGSINVFGIASPGQVVAVNVYEGVVSFFQPTSLNNRIIEGGYFISGSGGGTTWQQAQPSAPGYFLYYDTGAGNPQIIYSNAAGAWTDQWGNSGGGGITFVGLASLQNILTIEDSNGNTIAGIDSGGNITGQTISANNDVLIAGQSVSAEIANTPQGFINYGFKGIGGTAWPATPIGGTEIALFELDQAVIGNRIYRFTMNPTIINVSTAASSAHMKLRFTTDGTTPTTSSPEACVIASRVEATGTDAMIGPLTCPFFPASNGTYRFLVTGFCGGGGYQFKNDDYVRCMIEDLGFNTGQNANNLIVLGTGGGGGNSPQNYTETFYGNSTWCYESNWGIQNVNGIMYQGAYQGEPNNGFKYSYIQWATGSLGNALNTVLNYPQVNWVKIRLTNQHTWYSGGMTVSLHSSTVLGGQGANVSNELLNFAIGEGQTLPAPIPSAGWAPWKAGGITYAVLYPIGGTTNLQYYGYFAGASGGAAVRPALIVNYNH